MDDDREKLLRSLSIDRQDAERSAGARQSYVRLMVPAVIGVAVLLVGLWFVLPQAGTGGHAEPRVPVAANTEPAAPPKAPAAERRPRPPAA